MRHLPLLVLLLTACAPWDKPAGANDLDGDGADDVLRGGTDCDDTDDTVFPGAPEVAGDGIDQDCDGADACYADVDGDGVGDETSLEPTVDGSCDEEGLSDLPGDCDDTEASVFPGADERCDDLDNDCDGDVDDVDTTTTWLLDHDDDGYGDPGFPWAGCNAPAGYIPRATVVDCDDFDAASFPGAPEVAADGIDQDCDGVDLCYLDGDGDGFGRDATVTGTTLACDASGESTSDEDCDDAVPSIFPEAPEACGPIDRDCDGTPGDDDTDATGLPTWYADSDGDSWGNDSVVSVGCVAPSGYVPRGGDCNDDATAVSPGADEVCNGRDDDCDDDIDLDDDSLTGATVRYADRDRDGFGDDDDSRVTCVDAEPYDTVLPGDCNDGLPGVNPDAPEMPGNTLDEDCDGTIGCFDDADGDGAAGDTTATTTEPNCLAAGLGVGPVDCDDNDADYIDTTYWFDGDNDGVGRSTGSIQACEAPSFYVETTGDCNDGNSAVFPGAPEVPGDQIDANCDGRELCFVDTDNDGAGTTDTVESPDLLCTATGEARRDDDCDDTDFFVSPTALEGVGDGVDSTCDGLELCYLDGDGDGVGGSRFTLSDSLTCDDPNLSRATGDCDDADSTRFPGAVETCEAGDQDCDGLVDNDDPDLVAAIPAHRDADGDGAGDPAITASYCIAPAGWVFDSSDCDDTTDAFSTTCPWRQVALGDGLVCAAAADGASACATGAGDLALPGVIDTLDVFGGTRCWIDDRAVLACDSAATGTPLSGTPTSGSFGAVALGAGVACALDGTGTPVCFGDDTGGVVSQAPAGPFDGLSVSDDRACAWPADGPATCWGTGACSATPSGHVKALSVDGGTVCAVAPDGTLSCVGCSNARTNQAPVTPLLDLADIDLGPAGACAVSSGGAVQCWAQQPGVDLTPPFLASPARTVTVGTAGACVTSADGLVRCWGAVPTTTFVTLP